MGDLSHGLQVQIMKNLFGYSTADLVASTAWFHLYNTTLNSAATPATTGRCAGTGYTPTNVALSTAQWTNPTTAAPSAVDNKNVVTWTTAAGAGWGTIKSVLVTSSSGTGGVAYWWDTPSSSSWQTVTTGNAVTASVGALDFTLT